MSNVPVIFMGVLNAVQRLDAAASFDADNQNYAVSAGTNRCIVAVVSVEGTDPIDSPSVQWGGQSMTLISNPDVGSPTGVRCTTFWMGETKIAAASGTILAVTGQSVNFGISIASYQNCKQATPTNKDVGERDNSTPVPLNIITLGIGSLVVAGSTSNASATATWNAEVTEQTDENPTGMGHSMADEIVPTAAEDINCLCTWTSQPRAVAAAFEVERF